MLYRLGRFSHRRRWLVLAAWALILVLFALGAKTLSGPMSNTFSIPGTESQKALDLMGERLPQTNADAASARVVFVGAVSTQNGKAAVEKTIQQLKSLPGVASATDPYTSQAVSADGGTAYSTVTYTTDAADITAADQARLLATGKTAPGIKVYFGGTAVQSNGSSGGATEGIGIAVAAVVLIVTFGSLLAAGLPLLTAIVGVALGLAGITTVSGFVHLAATTTALASMLGLAVGIDYALFIVSRYRHELLVGHEPDDAAGRAVGTAGSAVVFAGATVIIALVALTVVNIPFLAAMGLGAAATVLIAVVVALTLLPALLGFLQTRVLGRRRRDTEAEDPESSEPVGARWARFVVRRRLPLALLVVVGLGVVALPALHMRLALPSDASAAPDSTQRKAYDALAKGFGAGFNGPLLIAVDLQKADAQAPNTIQTDLTALPDTAFVAKPSVVNQLALYTLIPTSGPDDAATETLVHTIRDHAGGWEKSTGAQVYVTGETAIGIDVSERLNGALIPYLAVVVGLAFLLLMLVFRSLVVPLKATLGFLLSLAATFGAVVTVFQNGHLKSLFGVQSTGPILSFLPILVIGILFGLAMDYEVFLVTRMREEHVHGAEAQEAVIHGFRHGARVVTAAAIIMTSVFAGFLLADDAIIKSLGFAMAAGVLFDAFLVRMTLVPAVMSLLGRVAWLIPGWLDRALPDVDVEGEKLSELLATGAIPSQRSHRSESGVRAL